MKRYNRLFMWTAIAACIVLAVYTWTALHAGTPQRDHAYRVEANRITAELNRGVPAEDVVRAADSPITRMEVLDAQAARKNADLFFGGAGLRHDEEFMVLPVYADGAIVQYVRFAYSVQGKGGMAEETALVLILAVILLVFALLIYIKHRIIKPFHSMEKLPLELAKGRLTPHLQENRNRFFGKFVWGLEMLRETLEAQRNTNLRLEKDRQTLIASVSHNIKTPVSAIKLYAAALGGNLYESEAKRGECARRIEENAEMIEKLVGDLIATSVSSLSEVAVERGEFYLGELMAKVEEHSKEKLALLKTRFTIGPYRDKLLFGDLERLAEAIDNIIENAMKYGDGAEIGITFHEEDYRQLIRIENSGAPVPPGELPHIFSSFWRGSNSAGKPGNGLGLYMCKQLLRKMDGDLYAEAGGHSMAFVLVLKC